MSRPYGDRCGAPSLPLNIDVNVSGSRMAIFLTWTGTGTPSAHAPVVLVLHGLTGSSGSHYVLGLQTALAARGWTSAALNWRGCSGEPNLLARSYPFGGQRNIRPRPWPIYAPHIPWPRLPLAIRWGAMCYSSTWASGSDSGLHGAVAVSVPFRLDQCADRIGLGFSRVYQAHFMREMLAYVKDKKQRSPARCPARRFGQPDQAGLGQSPGAKCALSGSSMIA